MPHLMVGAALIDYELQPGTTLVVVTPLLGATADIQNLLYGITPLANNISFC